MSTAQEKMDILENLTDEQLLERAWCEIKALCGSEGRPKKWTMTVPVDADRDSDVLFGRVLRRFGEIIAEREALRELLIEAQKLLEPYPITNFNVTNSMYADLWERINKQIEGGE